MEQKQGIAIADIADRHAGLLLALPALLIVSLFVVLPFLTAVYSSFTDQSVKTMLNPGLEHFVGVANYRELLSSDVFFRALANTGYFVAVAVPLQTILALGFALLVNGSGLWRKLLRTCFFLPVVTSMAVLSITWALLFNPTYGAINALLGTLGIPPQLFLDSPGQAMNCIIVMSIWQGAGFQMMIFLAGMQSIPPQLYEAARVEGASVLQRVRFITLPLLRNTTVFVVIITTIFAFKLFVQPHLITHGGPEGATRTLILLLYDEAFTNGRYGRASALAVIFFVVVLAVAGLQRVLAPREMRS